MAKNLKFSPIATKQMYHAIQKFNIKRGNNYIPLRIALARSLQSKQNPSEYQSDFKLNEDEKKERFEVQVDTLEQNDGLLIRALLNQVYEKKLTEDEYEQYLLEHIEHGLALIYEETQKMLGYEYLIDIAKDSISDLPKFKDMDFQEVPKDTGFSDLISIHVGIEKDSEKSLDINFNKIDEHANNYVGIVGKPGSGKTYFSKYFLEQLRKKTNYQTNFIIFDYAKGDIANDENFIKETNAEVINVKRQPIPLNPFYLVENSEQEQKYAAERIVEIFVNVEAHLGNVQEQNLYNAIMQAYEDRTYQNPPYPDFYEVFQQLELINDKPDTLTSIFRPLTEHNIFARSGEKIWHSLHDRTAIIDIHELPALKDLCVFFVLKEIYDKIMVMPDSDVEEDMKTRKMRTVIVLDEAHHFLENRKRVKVLAKMIREIRSKGASVMLLSQSPDDYKNADFNFLEMLEFVFVLQCSPSSHNFLQQVFRIDSSKAKKLITDVANMSPHRAITLNNSNEVREVLLCR